MAKRWVALAAAMVGGLVAGRAPAAGPAIAPAAGDPEPGAAGSSGSAGAGAVAPDASPQEPAASDDAEGAEAEHARARAHFERALEDYRSGRYHDAAAELRAALKLDPESRDLVYNLGLVYEKLGELDRAIAQLLRLLEIERDPVEIERVILMLRRLEGARRERERQRAAEAERVRRERAPEQPAQPVRRSGSGSEPERMDGWVLGSGAAAAVAVGAAVALGVAALVVRPGPTARTDDDTSVGDLQARTDVAHSLAVAADVSLAIGAVAGATAVMLYVVPDAPVEERGAAPQPAAPAALAAGLRVRGRFF